MTNRLLSSALILAILAISMCVFGNCGFAFLIIVLGAFTQWEFYRLLQKIDARPSSTIGIICGLFLTTTTFFSGAKSVSAELLFISIIPILLKSLLSHSLNSFRKELMPTIIGVICAPLTCCFPITLLNAMSLIFSSSTCIFTLFWIIIVSKCCDIGGMFAGKYYGKRKLAPNFSPKKTVEGLFGGVLLSILMGMFLLILGEKLLPPQFSLGKTIALSVILSAFAIAGDLTESAIKRLAKQKDSSSIIPGIGGIFDLTDSLLLALPIGTLFIKYFVL